MKDGLSLSRLIELVGNDNVRIDNLSDTLMNSSTSKRGLTRLTFVTKAINTNEVYRWTSGEATMVGLVVWMPKPLVDQALATYRAEEK